MTTLTVLISPTGSLQFVWDDKLQPLIDIGRASIERVSHVEPTSAGQWSADLSPIAGPVLGPFRRRGEALAAEREWLSLHRGI